MTKIRINNMFPINPMKETKAKSKPSKINSYDVSSVPADIVSLADMLRFPSLSMLERN